uniref:Uncharacterized protein n=1 Tax=Oryza meridionalis TaxID=40149 RepID=A0A0E0E0X3_9ORYZ
MGEAGGWSAQTSGVRRRWDGVVGGGARGRAVGGGARWRMGGRCMGARAECGEGAAGGAVEGVGGSGLRRRVCCPFELHCYSDKSSAHAGQRASSRLSFQVVAAAQLVLSSLETTAGRAWRVAPRRALEATGYSDEFAVHPRRPRRLSSPHPVAPPPPPLHRSVTVASVPIPSPSCRPRRRLYPSGSAMRRRSMAPSRHALPNLAARQREERGEILVYPV